MTDVQLLGSLLLLLAILAVYHWVKDGIFGEHEEEE